MLNAALLTLSLTLAAGKPSLAVLYFDNNTKSEDLEVMRKGLADMMVTDLVAWDGVAVVERDKFESVVAELKLQRTKFFDQSTAVKIGKFLEAQYLLTGSMAISGQKLILDARLLDTSKNQVVVTARADGPKDDVFPIEQELVERIAAGIDLKVKNEGARKKAKVPSLEALLAYSKAIDLTDQGKMEEAEAAFAALVSKSPMFLMARERKDAAVKALGDYKKRQRDLVTASTLEVGKLADDVLKKEEAYASLTPAEQTRFLAMRQVKRQFLARLLRQHLSSRDARTKAVLPNKRAQALEILKALYTNDAKLLVEVSTRAGSSMDWSDSAIDPTVANQVREAFFDPPSAPSEVTVLTRHIRFVFEGDLDDGVGLDGQNASYRVIPTWADLSPADAAATWKLLDARIERALAAASSAAAAQQQLKQYEAIQLLEMKAETLARLRRDDDAVSAFQRILDLFPTANGNASRERKIKQIIGGEHDHERNALERFAKGLKTCEDMDLRVGAPYAEEDFLKHKGIDGIDAFWAVIEKACPPSSKNRSILAYLAKDLAMDLARFDQCERSKAYWLKYLEHDGSVSDMLGYHKNYTPWCQYDDLRAKVSWFRFDEANFDEKFGTRNRGLEEGQMSVRAHDGSQLALSARNETGSLDVSLYLVPDGQGWKCRNASWRNRDGDQVDGTCTAKLTRLGKDKGDFDEGTFTANFTYQQDGRPYVVKLLNGDFRLRRQ